MSAINELIEHLINFTPEQLEKFVQNPLTQSFLQAEEVTESFPLEESLCG